MMIDWLIVTPSLAVGAFVLGFTARIMRSRQKPFRGGSADKDACSNCKFWKEGSYPSECLRHAPSTTRDGSRSASWPMTQGSDWCGDYDEKPGAKQKGKPYAYKRLRIRLPRGVLVAKLAKHSHYWERDREVPSVAFWGFRLTWDSEVQQ